MSIAGIRRRFAFYVEGKRALPQPLPNLDLLRAIAGPRVFRQPFGRSARPENLEASDVLEGICRRRESQE